MRKSLFKITVLTLAVACVVGAVCLYRSRNRDLIFVKKMGAGINIGNSLDASGLRDYRPDAGDLEYETYWNDEPISEEMMQAIHEAGFGTVRIPVTWEEHLDENGNISADWLERVAEVANMAEESGLYVIIDLHHENWMNLETDREAEITEEYLEVWSQIATRFQDHDEHLIFEAMNEPRLRDSEHEWDGGTKELRDMVNRLNQAFVDLVRESGGNNADRYLMVTPYGSSCRAEALEGLDVNGKRLILSVHAYIPYDFCQNEEGSTDWETEELKTRETIEEVFSDLKTQFIDRKIPVMITEFGCKDKGNDKARESWTAYYVQQAKAAGLSYVWWDDGGDYALLNRADCSWKFPEIVKLLV